MPWINCIDWILTSIWLMKLLTFTTSVTILVLHVPSFHTRNPTLPNPGTSPVLTTTFVILPELSWELLTAETCLVVSLLPYPILILNGPSHWSYTRDFERCLFCCLFSRDSDLSTSVVSPLVSQSVCLWPKPQNIIKSFIITSRVLQQGSWSIMKHHEASWSVIKRHKQVSISV